MLEHRIQQVKKTTMSQNIVQQLMELIINGTVPRGGKLPSEKQLMEMFGVGRSTLREAIRALIALGLVEIRVPEGTFVTESFGDFFTKHLDLISKISFNNIVELLEARVQLESILAEMAAYKSSAEDHKKLDMVIKDMESALNNEQFLNADLDFHILIAKCANNSFLFEVMNILRQSTGEWVYKVIERSSDLKTEVTQQHYLIANAIKEKDGEAAKKAMVDHLEKVNKRLMDLQEGIL